MAWAEMKKTIYSPDPLRQLLLVANRRTNGKNSGQISRTMKRLRVHGLIKKLGHKYKYYLTALGKQVVALGLKLKEIHIIPALCVEPDCWNSCPVRSESVGIGTKVLRRVCYPALSPQRASPAASQFRAAGFQIPQGESHELWSEHSGQGRAGLLVARRAGPPFGPGHHSVPQGDPVPDSCQRRRVQRRGQPG